MSQMPTTLIPSFELEALHHQATLIGKKNKHRSGSQRIGQQHSTNRGAGLELEDLRNYQAGDDVRHIAWRASARQSTPLSKVFQTEQQERRIVCLEQHAGMCFGSQTELKASRATQCAAALCFASLGRGADIAAVLTTSKTQQWPYTHRLDDSLDFINQANQIPISPAPIQRPTALLKQLQHFGQRHSQICIISDFFHWQDEDFLSLTSLTPQHSILVLHVVDPGELKLDASATLRLMDSHSGARSTINTNLAELQQAYAERMNNKVQHIRQQLKQLESEYVYCDGKQPLLTLLEEIL